MPSTAAGVEPRVELQGVRIPVTRGSGGTWRVDLGKSLQPRFYFLKVEAGQSPDILRDRYLFQIYKNSWKGWFPGEEGRVDPIH